MSGEIAEVESFLSQAKYSGLKGVLTTYLNKLKETAQNDAVEEVTPEDIPSPSKIVSAPIPVVSSINTSATSAQFIPLENFAWDQGQYGTPTVTIYAEIDNVIDAKDRVNVIFTPYSFDLTVMDLNGKNYRLLKQNLDKEILPSDSKFIVKRNKVIVKLAKKKGEYSYENWTNLTSKTKTDPAKKKEDPMGGIMDMMKNMYDEGDEQTKKMIGEAMMKSRNGEKMEPPSPPSMGNMDFGGM